MSALFDANTHSIIHSFIQHSSLVPRYFFIVHNLHPKCFLDSHAHIPNISLSLTLSPHSHLVFAADDSPHRSLHRADTLHNTLHPRPSSDSAAASSFSPPLSPAITLSLPLSILWKHSNHYYGSFAAWVAFRSEVETARTASGIRGFLFLFTQYTIFGIPHFYRRGGECIGVLRFATDLLSLETPPIEPAHVLAFALSIDTPTGVRTEHFVAM